MIDPLDELKATPEEEMVAQAIYKATIPPYWHGWGNISNTQPPWSIDTHYQMIIWARAAINALAD